MQDRYQIKERQLEDLVREQEARDSSTAERAAAQDQEVRKLRDEVVRSKEGRQSASPAVQLEAKLREQLGKKDRLVRALRDAVKQLGTRPFTSRAAVLLLK